MVRTPPDAAAGGPRAVQSGGASRRCCCPLIAVPLLWRSPRSRVAALADRRPRALPRRPGAAAWVLGQVPDGTSGQGEKLMASSLNTCGSVRADAQSALPREPRHHPRALPDRPRRLAALLVVAALFAMQYRAIIAAEEQFLREQFGRGVRGVVRAGAALLAAASCAGAARGPGIGRRALRKEHNPAAAWIALAMLLVASDRLQRRSGPAPSRSPPSWASGSASKAGSTAGCAATSSPTSAGGCETRSWARGRNDGSRPGSATAALPAAAAPATAPEKPQTPRPITRKSSATSAAFCGRSSGCFCSSRSAEPQSAAARRG